MRRNGFNAQLVVGLVIIAIGILFILDNLGEVYAWDYLRYWPALFILIGLAKLFDPHANKFWASMFIMAGTLLLLDRLRYIDFNIGDWWPLFLIALGGTILWGSLRRRQRQSVAAGGSVDNDDSVLTITAIMGGFERRVSSKDFRGGNITTIMGGCQLDLRQAEIKQDEVVIDVVAIFGGIEMTVPDTWTIVVKGVPIMGGISDETRSSQASPTKRLVIQGTVIMGGVEVKN